MFVGPQSSVITRHRSCQLMRSTDGEMPAGEKSTRASVLAVAGQAGRAYQFDELATDNWSSAPKSTEVGPKRGADVERRC